MVNQSKSDKYLTNFNLYFFCFLLNIKVSLCEHQCWQKLDQPLCCEFTSVLTWFGLKLGWFWEVLGLSSVWNIYFNGKQVKKNLKLSFTLTSGLFEFKSVVNYFLKEFVKKKSVLVNVLDSYFIVVWILLPHLDKIMSYFIAFQHGTFVGLYLMLSFPTKATLCIMHVRTGLFSF